MSVAINNSADSSRRLTDWLNRRMLWVSRHWLWVANIFFLVYFGLPLLAPVLMAAGFTGAANTIYQLYNMVCHQLPTRAYFIFGEQVSMCQRCIAIYATLFTGGVVFALARFRALPAQWYLLFALPMALDGGSALVSELAQVLPLWIFWGLWTLLAVLVIYGLHLQKLLVWQVVVLFAGGFLALAYLQFVGLRISDVTMRTITGVIFGIGTVWFAYPALEEGFADTAREISAAFAHRRQDPTR
ncbi:MAG: hypothetical protein Kow0031_28560 [Anaerolineae bacterium]